MTPEARPDRVTFKPGLGLDLVLGALGTSLFRGRAGAESDPGCVCLLGGEGDACGVGRGCLELSLRRS